ncbi:MAG: isoleucine--tRNA ligase [Phycisphaeraceae bacterium]|nr:isoleucine--tRNA ligase [Phycisphaeraceae bacterium]MCW5763276.1 isoleucine--tRNA ligase [Phycisphaeraceae bacterium]
MSEKSAPSAQSSARDYKKSLNLPTTTFAMKANLVQNEPASQKRWEQEGLYGRLRAQGTGKSRGTFNFHDGPPYANGSIHLGHLMNKCLKDFVVRTRTMMGYDCPYVPGWDCHGLPIEHKVMTELVESGKAAKLDTLADDVRRMAIRRECQKYAEKFQKLQASQMKRLLTLADYDKPYLTMSPDYEGATLEVLAELLKQGLVYRALKPVHWSIANETALAEAELEYQDREDLSVYVDFEALDAGKVYDAFNLSADDRPTQTPSFMIWTTTPWTLPANVAVAVQEKAEYALVRVDGNITVLAADLVERVTKNAGAEAVEVLAVTRGEKLLGLRYKHPFVTRVPECGLGHICSVEVVWSLVSADYVTLEDGTGLVHTAPGHGAEDYQTGLKHGLPIYCPVLGNGRYDDTAPEHLRGVSIWDANESIAKQLRDSGHLFHSERFSHSYPHDWRSKTPVIFRCTEQWFVSVEKPSRHCDLSLRQLALRCVDINEIEDRGLQYPEARATLDSRKERRAAEQAETRQLQEELASGEDESRPLDPSQKRDLFRGIKDVRCVTFIPAWGRNRMRGMLESRPDWCISRQRAWGLPIPAFEFENGEVLMTEASTRAVARVFRAKGSDSWFQLSPAELLADYDSKADVDAPESVRSGEVRLESARKGGDILDVWFESGSSWNAVMRERFGDAAFPTDLYLEGSDQHRGWFQLSLLTSLGAQGVAPFKTLLTHGFMVDKDGRKLSKSAGHTIESLFEHYGADVMRWWVCSLSYENDVKVDDEFFKLAGESYRKVRNTLRFMLSNLNDIDASSVAPTLASIEPTSLDAWVLAEFDALAGRVIGAYERYDFRAAHAALYDFCNDTLSAVYLAAVKDRLYCDRIDAPRRRRTQATLHALTDGLCRLLAPVMCHTADEAYGALYKGAGDACVHTREFLASVGVKAHVAWADVLRLRDEVMLALEAAKKTGLDNPLDAWVEVGAGSSGEASAWDTLAHFDPADLADLCGVSRVMVQPGGKSLRIINARERFEAGDASAARCERSWKRDGTVRERSDGGMLSDRDAQAVGQA